MEVILRGLSRKCVSIRIRRIKAITLFALLWFILFKFYTKAPKWTDCSQFKDKMNFPNGAIPHFECEISKNDPKPGILNLLQYLKPHWDIKKVILYPLILYFSSWN